MLSKYRQILLLNLLWVAVYFVVFGSLKMPVHDSFMFWTPDSQEYLNVGTEFYDFSATGFSNTRPFLYPLVILLVHTAFGAWGLWLIQFCFWLAAVNFLFFSLRKATGNLTAAIIGSSLMVLNFSTIGATLQGLTETTTIFLLSWLLFELVSRRDRIAELPAFHRSLLILVLLTVVKPLFFLPLIFVLLVLLPLYYGKKYFRAPRMLVGLVLVLLPLFFQLTIMKVKYDKFTVSEISSLTIRHHWLAQGMQALDKDRKWEDVVAEAQTYSTEKVIEQLSEHKALYWNLYWLNMRENIDAKADFVCLPEHYKHKGFSRYMGNVNMVYYYLHIVFIIPVLLAIWLACRRKLYEPLMLLLFATGMTAYILFTSGISFWQGDRLVLSALPVFLFLYVFVVHFLIKTLRRVKSEATH